MSITKIIQNIIHTKRSGNIYRNMEYDEQNTDHFDLFLMGRDKICVGKKLLGKIEQLQHIDGISKIRKKVCSEINSLEKLIDSSQLKLTHILCSNLVHFDYLIETLSKTEQACGVDVPIKISGRAKSTFRVDIIADGGRTWIKTIARNAKALSDIALGRSNYGTKSILDHAANYKHMALENQYCFNIPKIIFDFANEIDAELETSLGELGIEIRIDGTCGHSKQEQIDHNDKQITLNLDVTTMMAYVSSLTNGSYDWQFKEEILTEQAKKESTTHVKKFLEDLFDRKQLIACETAISSFLKILNTVGGENEKIRSNQFLKRIRVLPDLTFNAEKNIRQQWKLQIGGKVQERIYKIISFGLYHKALTVTANKRVIESAKMQGVNIPSIVHEARALTEQKEKNAKKGLSH